MTNRELVDLLTSGPGSFSREWLGEGNKSTAPIAAHALIDSRLAQRLGSTAQKTGHNCVFVGHLSPARVDEHVVRIPSAQADILRALSWCEEGFVVTLPDLSGALLMTNQHYALIAGDEDFFRYAVPEGGDQAAINFKRYAQRVGQDFPAVADVSAAFRPRQRAWAKRSDVVEGSATSEQLSLMDAFAEEGISGSDFADSWLTARHRAQEQQERLRENFSGVMKEVFYALEDYSIDPRFREDGDLTDTQLREVVRNALSEVESLD
ncbi:colicin immunity domain-containing protein [Streptomyces sp. QH1-20]|uniref:colicin immunity domain-containing protein n=1 Tax=Streptomyces sp. QH1-20 TaxID=3240934 RepID=UPI0035166C99